MASCLTDARRPALRAMLLLLTVACCPAPQVWAQRDQVTLDRKTLDRRTLDLLVKRIDQLEARVKELEADKLRSERGADSLRAADPASSQAAAPSEPVRPVAVVASARPGAAVSAVPSFSSSSAQAAAAIPNPRPLQQEPDPAQPDNLTTERLDLSKTLLRIRGFGDVSLHRDSVKGDNTTGDSVAPDANPFSLGQLDLFITSDISDRFRFLSDILFEGGPDRLTTVSNVPQVSMKVDVERYLLQYSHNDYLNISAGRGKASIGYYSAAYQHSTWLQTATGRPLLFEFEDRGGILPIHMVGLSATGQIPSGALGLHYVAEAGNGRSSRTAINSPLVQSHIDDENHIAFNLAAFARPEALPGYQAGFSVYHDVVSLPTVAGIHEWILAAHSVLNRPRYEFLNEAVLDRQALIKSARIFNTPGFYSQVSRQFGPYRPYFRYQYMNVAKDNPMFSDLGLRHGPSAGLRYDASESVALKFQYDYTLLRNQGAIHGFTGQVGFTF